MLSIMKIRIVPAAPEYFSQILAIWNEVLDEGLTFPWIEPFTMTQLKDKLRSEHAVGCAVDENGAVLGMFHVQPNSAGRLAHVAGCGYMVTSSARGQGIGRMLVRASIEAARQRGFKGIQFNAVVSSNHAALALYRSEGFADVGIIPGGFLLKSGEYVDMHIMFLAL
jgi:ribosomal protein S18 acetylase RimI-like enzyme